MLALAYFDAFVPENFANSIISNEENEILLPWVQSTIRIECNPLPSRNS